MSDLESARVQVALIRTAENQAGYYRSVTPRVLVLWLCDQLSSFLNGVQALWVNEETVRKLEAKIIRLQSVRVGLYEDVCGERDRLREQLAELQQRYDNTVILCETMTTGFAKAKEQAIAQGFEKALCLAEAVWQSEGDGDLVLVRLKNEAAAIRKEEGA